MCNFVVYGFYLQGARIWLLEDCSVYHADCPNCVLNWMLSVLLAGKGNKINGYKNNWILSNAPKGTFLSFIAVV
jgi:hypothetical protein